VLRFASILAAFALGVVTCWLLTRPTTGAARSAVVSSGVVDRSAERAAVRAPTAPRATGAPVGVPPDVVTPPAPAAHAGERRALARAIERLAAEPSAPPPSTVDAATLEVLAESLRTKLQARMQGGEAP
jgi:hypothetical protein